MAWYWMICLLLAYPCWVQRAGRLTGRDTRQLALSIACLILWVFLALRGTSVGTDTKYYCYVFRQFRDIPWSRVLSAVTYGSESKTWSFDFEPGYRIYNKLVSLLCSDQQAITVANSILLMVLLRRWIGKSSCSGLMSIWLYVTLGLYQTHMNTTRNAIAIFFVYLAFPYIEKRQFRHYALRVLLAASFHKTALVFLPLYWLLNRPIRRPGLIWGLVAGSAAVGLNFDLVRSLFTTVLPEGLAKYFYKENLKPEMLLVGILYLLLVVLILLLMEPGERRRAMARCPGGVWMFALNQCCFGLNLGINAAARMAALFGPYLILFIPQLLGCMESPKRRDLAAGLICLGCGAQYVLRMLINNIGGSMPYVFFFNP